MELWYIRQDPSVEAIDQVMQPVLEKLRVPPGHVNYVLIEDEYGHIFKRDLDRYTEGSVFKSMWDIQKGVYAQVVFNLNPKDYTLRSDVAVIQQMARLNPEELVLTITSGLVERDIHYQKEQRTPGDDPHESFLRTYALARSFTKSEVLDQLFEQIGSLIGRVTSIPDLESLSEEQLKFRNNIYKLAISWESTHPNQRFWEPLLQSTA